MAELPVIVDLTSGEGEPGPSAGVKRRRVEPDPEPEPEPVPEPELGPDVLPWLPNGWGYLAVQKLGGGKILGANRCPCDSLGLCLGSPAADLLLCSGVKGVRLSHLLLEGAKFLLVANMQLDPQLLESDLIAALTADQVLFALDERHSGDMCAPPCSLTTDAEGWMPDCLCCVSGLDLRNGCPLL